MEDLKKALSEGKVIFGTERTLKAIKSGEVKNIYLSKDCKEETKEDIIYYSNIKKLNIKNLEIPASELGMICKKQFSVAVLSF